MGFFCQRHFGIFSSFNVSGLWIKKDIYSPFHILEKVKHLEVESKITLAWSLQYYCKHVDSRSSCYNKILIKFRCKLNSSINFLFAQNCKTKNQTCYKVLYKSCPTTIPILQRYIPSWKVNGDYCTYPWTQIMFSFEFHKLVIYNQHKIIKWEVWEVSDWRYIDISMQSVYTNLGKYVFSDFKQYSMDQVRVTFKPMWPEHTV